MHQSWNGAFDVSMRSTSQRAAIKRAQAPAIAVSSQKGSCGRTGSFCSNWPHPHLPSWMAPPSLLHPLHHLTLSTRLNGMNPVSQCPALPCLVLSQHLFLSPLGGEARWESLCLRWGTRTFRGLCSCSLWTLVHHLRLQQVWQMPWRALLSHLLSQSCSMPWRARPATCYGIHFWMQFVILIFIIFISLKTHTSPHCIKMLRSCRNNRRYQYLFWDLF